VNRKSLLVVVAFWGACSLIGVAQNPASPDASSVQRPVQRVSIRPVTQDDLAKPAGADWLTYHGAYIGGHYSTLSEIDLRTVGNLRRAWVSDTDPFARAGGAGGRGRAGGGGAGAGVPGPAAAGAAAPAGRRGGGAAGPPAAPVPPGRTGVGRTQGNGGTIASGILVRDGVLFYTSGVNAFAVDGRTGQQRWHYVARSNGGLSNRGLAIWNDTLFMLANGGLTALDVATGAEKWVKELDGAVPAAAPFVVRDHVYVSVGSDAAVARSSLESRNARTGEREWIWYTVPKEGEFGFNTWPTEEEAGRGQGTPWQAPTYDPEQNLLIFGTGNPDPIKDNRARPGDNLFTDCTVALDADTGKLAWYFQATPNDDHDYDNVQSMSLATIKVNGMDRKVVTWISRNGYFYTVDRTTGENIVTSKIFPTINWAQDRLRSSGTPESDRNKSAQRGGVLVSPSSEGAVNYPAQSFSPVTGWHYSNVVSSYSPFYWTGETFLGTFRNSLRATDPATGKVMWQHEYLEPNGINARYASVLTTASGLLFTGDISGNVIAFDAKTGRILWHDELPEASMTGVPVSYMIDGAQYLAVPSGSKVVAYRLP
jgi:alcohol dehydrogenase (cytochrome c)